MSILDIAFSPVGQLPQSRFSGLPGRQKKRAEAAISPPIKQKVLTGAAAGLRMHSEALRRMKLAAWRPAMEKLAALLDDPDSIADLDVDPPSPEIVGNAIAVAMDLFAKSHAAPTSVTPDANGGVVFEHSLSDGAEQIHFWDDGTVEYLAFKGTSIVERKLIGGHRGD
jgi:hypothetical protein